MAQDRQERHMRGTSSNHTLGVDKPSWRALADVRLRPLDAATYSGLAAGLADDEVLIARVAVVRQGRFYAHEHEIACWVANGEKYDQLIHGSDARNQEVKGYYAVSKDRLLRLVFG